MGLNKNGKIRNKILASLILIVLFIMVVCLIKKNRTASDLMDNLNHKVIEIIMTNYVDGDLISEADIALDQIYYGSFSKENADEILVISKILNTPHVAGLDKRVSILLKADSLEFIAYKEFGSDIVALNCVQTHNGLSRIIVTNTMIYQGIATQAAELFSLNDGVWNPIPLEYLNNLKDEYFCFIADDLLIVASGYSLATVPSDNIILPEDIVAILVWNSYTEQFIVSDYSSNPGNSGLLSSNYYGFSR